MSDQQRITRTFAVGLAKKLYECFSDGRWVSEDIYEIIEDVLAAHASMQRVISASDEPSRLA